jgi:hypothetical protein
MSDLEFLRELLQGIAFLMVTVGLAIRLRKIQSMLNQWILLGQRTRDTHSKRIFALEQTHNKEPDPDKLTSEATVKEQIAYHRSRLADLEGKIR